MAPEVTLGNPYDEKCDVFSFAIIVYEVLFETIKPYTELFRVEQAVALKNVRPLVPQDTQFSQQEIELIEIMKHSWSANPKDRMSFDEIFKRLKEISL